MGFVLYFSYDYNRALDLGGKDHNKVPFLSHIKGSYYHYDLSLSMIMLITWVDAVFVTFLYYNVTLLLLPFHTVLFGRRSLSTGHIYGLRSNVPHP